MVRADAPFASFAMLIAVLENSLDTPTPRAGARLPEPAASRESGPRRERAAVVTSEARPTSLAFSGMVHSQRGMALSGATVCALAHPGAPR
jgi:hypothetical protein